MNKALFLDRDGVINKNFGHVYRIANFKFRKGIFELIKTFQDNNFLIIIVTNQAGIGKRLYSMNDFNILNNWMISRFKTKGIRITDVFFCWIASIDSRRGSISRD
jgi:D-glycero-D-manno-heptose 1,7-bisphosphate phosphatase